MKLVFLLLVFLSMFETSPVPVPSDPECITEPVFVIEYQEDGFCNAQEPFGDVYMFVCKIKLYSEYFGEYEGLKFLHTCIYTPTLELPTKEMFITFLPVVNNNPTIMSHLP